MPGVSAVAGERKGDVMWVLSYNAQIESGWVAVIQPEGGEPRAFTESASRGHASTQASRMAYRQNVPVIEGRGTPWLLPEEVLVYGKPAKVLQNGKVFVWEEGR